jgi:hypothetical protein
MANRQGVETRLTLHRASTQNLERFAFRRRAHASAFARSFGRRAVVVAEAVSVRVPAEARASALRRIRKALCAPPVPAARAA